MHSITRKVKILIATSVCVRGRALTLPLLGSEKRHPLLFLQGKFTAHAARTAHSTNARGRTAH